MDKTTTIHELKEKVRIFCEDRDWDKYHTAKDLAIGMITEAAELLEKFRFKSEKEINDLFKDEKKKQEMNEEIADILHFVLRFSQIYKIDLSTELIKKIEKNAKNYPIEKSKGNNKKYNEL